MSCLKRVFCCADRSKIGKWFGKGIKLQAQELNITSLIKGQRESRAILGLLRQQLGPAEVSPVVDRAVSRLILLEGQEPDAVKFTDLDETNQGTPCETSMALIPPSNEPLDPERLRSRR